jgi:tRNA threonylcarbamoyladenosine biosynthesis protein TsaE
MDVETVTTHAETETTALGEAFSRRLRPGEVVLLRGELGAGKTAFVRGMAAGLGIDPEEVSSPTFTLVQEYRGGRMTLYHVDLYRLRPNEVDDLGLEELTAENGVTAIEWAERLPRPLGNAIEVRIESPEDSVRRITITPSGSSAPPS